MKKTKRMKLRIRAGVSHTVDQKRNQNIRNTRKRKLSLEEIGSCHPRVTRQGPTKRCLPSAVYQQIITKNGKQNQIIERSEKKGKGEKNTPYTAVGCQEGEDHCLLDKSSLSDEEKKKLRKTYLRPRMPKEWNDKPNTWLDNFNIQHVMKQYEEAFAPRFRFLGVFPIDFSSPNPYRTNGKVTCLNEELCKLNIIKEYEAGVRGIGMVFNLDPHDKSGSHWVALYINLESIQEPVIGYFDSYGYETPEMIARFMKSLTLQVKTCRLAYNGRRFQYGQSECGMFSMYFLICMIYGISFEDFCKDAVHDRSMLELRSILFRR